MQIYRKYNFLWIEFYVELTLFILLFMPNNCKDRGHQGFAMESFILNEPSGLNFPFFKLLGVLIKKAACLDCFSNILEFVYYNFFFTSVSSNASTISPTLISLYLSIFNPHSYPFTTSFASSLNRFNEPSSPV